MPWLPLQVLWAKVVVEILELGGHSPLRIHNYIIMGDVALRIDSMGTYVPLILAGLPFVWRGEHLVRNALRIIFFVTIICMANAGRLYLTITWWAEGMSWVYAHDLTNHLTYGPIVVLTLFLWLRAMRRRYDKQLEEENKVGNR